MAQQAMYPALANSPGTEITTELTSAAVTISVLDATKLPAAPNLLTIGTDDNPETVLYTGKSGNNLTGCTRGFNGTTAQSWIVGSKVARYFTAYDHDTFRSNILDVAGEVESARTGAGPDYIGYDTLPERLEVERAEIISRLDTTNAQLADMAINVKNYGAVGDGITDDTMAISNALDVAISLGINLYFPAGVYIISSRILKDVPSGTIKMVGDGPSSVLKMADAVGEYHSMLYFIADTVIIENLYFDMNSRNNPRTSTDHLIDVLPLERRRYTLVLVAIRNRIVNNVFYDSMGVNVMYAAPNRHIADSEKNAYFDFLDNRIIDTGLNAHPDLAYDHSSILIIANQKYVVKVKDNVFKGANPGNSIALGAIELDCCNAECSGNVVENYHGCVLTTDWGLQWGTNGTTYVNMSIHHNTLVNGRAGVGIWSDYGYRGLVVHDNEFHINPSLFVGKNYSNHINTSANPRSNGIVFQQIQTPLSDVEIYANTIKFEPGLSLVYSLSFPDSSYGIGGANPFQALVGLSENIIIRNNTIINAPAYGIYLAFKHMQRISINDNIFINCGQCVSSVANAMLIRLESNFSDATLIEFYIQRNKIIDQNSDCNYDRIISLSSSSAFNNVTISDNKYTITNAASVVLYYHIAAVVNNLLLQDTLPTYKVSIGSNSLSKSSLLYVADTGYTIRFNDFTPIYFGRGSSPPASGSFTRGSFIENTVPNETGTSPNKYIVRGWRCTVAGSPGTFVEERTATGG